MSAQRGNGGGSSVETVLLVEDEAAVRGMLRTLLEMQGYTVVEAADGPTALRMLTEHPGPIHLLLSDVMLPGGVHGPDLAEAFTRQHPGAAVLLTSGYSEHQVLGHGLDPQGVAFLPKPFSPGALMRKVRELLSRNG